MTRIVGGRAGGRRLRTPKSDATRPTTDRVREALFSALVSRLGDLDGLRLLDLYAGSGAVGLEAWSRGAEVVLVESDRRTAALIRDNARTLGAAEPQVRVETASVSGFLAGPAAAGFDVVFADPPYPLADDRVGADLDALVVGGWLAADAVVVVERATRSPEPAWPTALEPLTSKRYGETTLWWACYRPAP